MLMFTLAISYLTTSNFPWFMNLTFQVPMQYCSLQHQSLILSPFTSTKQQRKTIEWERWRRQWQPTPVLLLGKSHGWRGLVGFSPWGREESDTTKWLHFHFSLSCIGEGNGNPFHYSCLENPGMAEPGGLLCMGSHRVRHDWSDAAAAATAEISSRKWEIQREHFMQK